MKRDSLLILLLVIFCICESVKADIAPPTGYTKVSINLNIETNEDLSDYKFYFDFFGDKKDVEIKNGQVIIPSMGGGVRYSAGTLWAVSKKDKNQPPIELLKHQFSKEVPISESQNVSPAIYRIERNGNTLKVTPLNQIAPKKSGGVSGEIDFSVRAVTKSLTIPGYIVIISFLLIIISIGIWLFSKRGRKSN